MLFFIVGFQLLLLAGTSLEGRSDFVLIILGIAFEDRNDPAFEYGRDNLWQESSHLAEN